MHSHVNPYLSLNLGAAYKESGTFLEQIIHFGQVVFRPANYQHKNLFSEGVGICLNIEVKDYSNQEILNTFKDVDVRQINLSMCKIFTGALLAYQDDELDCLITEFLLCDQSKRYAAKCPSWHRNVIDQIKHQYNECISLKSLALSNHIHPNYLARKFKEIEGITIGAYIRRIRIEQSFKSILSSKNSLTNIALQSGFYDQAHFSNTFRAAFRANPKKVRNTFNKLI